MSARPDASLPVRVAVLIPARDEEKALPSVLADLRRFPGGHLGKTEDGRSILLARIVVIDNGSIDGTAEAARRAGVQVVDEPRRGYGRACLTGITSLATEAPDIVAFMDADHSDDVSMLPDMVRPIADDELDLVLGSRITGVAEPGALLPQARFGNGLAVRLIHMLYGFRYTDLGPFRAIGYRPLLDLGMLDENYGWTVEMQVKALLNRIRVREIPVAYRRRIGRSKIAGTLSGSVKAGAKILWTIAMLRLGHGFNPDRG